MISGKMRFMKVNVWYKQNVTYSNKNYLPLQTIISGVLKNFGTIPRKHSRWF